MERLVFATLLACLAACGGEPPRSSPVSSDAASGETGQSAERAPDASAFTAQMNEIAEDFVRLGLELGTYDKDYVDAYHGPAEWRTAATDNPRSLDRLRTDAQALIERLSQLSPDTDLARARRDMLRKQAVAALTRIRMAAGETFSFDEETRLLYDAVAPEYDLADFDAALAEIDQLLPGDGPLNERVDAFRNALAIPTDKLEAVFDAAIAECARRTRGHYDLPPGESFSVGYVTDKPWGGYNWYQGDFESLIEINTDFPVIIDRAVDLGCHEGYPGHHTWNVLVERDFLNRNGWVEYTIYPLFSPQSLIGEGSANYGIELAFPDGEKAAFEKDVLYPLAGLDPQKADEMAALNKARRTLAFSRNHIARAYLDGDIDRDEAISLSMKYGLSSRERAEQGIRFIDTYRGYVLNYNIGRDLVGRFVAAVESDGGDPWAAFETLLTTPLSASDIEARARAIEERVSNPSVAQ